MNATSKHRKQRMITQKWFLKNLKKVLDKIKSLSYYKQADSHERVKRMARKRARVFSENWTMQQTWITFSHERWFKPDVRVKMTSEEVRQDKNKMIRLKEPNRLSEQLTSLIIRLQKTRQADWTYNGEFDPGSGRTLAARLTHASRTDRILSGKRLVANGWVTRRQPASRIGTTARKSR